MLADDYLLYRQLNEVETEPTSQTEHLLVPRVMHGRLAYSETVSVADGCDRHVEAGNFILPVSNLSRDTQLQFVHH
jgi:hypothetical protein